MSTTAARLVTLLATVTMPVAAQSKPTESRPTKGPALERPKLSRNGGYLGIFFEEVRMRGDVALHIKAVQKNSDAAKLGFKTGDFIVAINGREFDHGDQFVRMLWSQAMARGGRRAKAENSITLLRHNGEKTVRIEAGLRELDRTPAVGQKAPDFTLRGMDGKTSTLSKLIGKRPIFLVFGSYT